MSKTIDLQPDVSRFHRLLVKSRASGRRGRSYYLCVCDCGKELEVQSKSLLSGNSKSCGCLRLDRIIEANTRHGYAKRERIASEYTTWRGMISRCYNEKANNYARYGGAGISVCDRWRFGENGASGFVCFVADMGQRPSRRHTIDRIDGSGSYDPNNCWWATCTEQARNKRNVVWVNVNGVAMTITYALGCIGRNIADGNYRKLLKDGLSPQTAFGELLKTSTPSMPTDMVGMLGWALRSPEHDAQCAAKRGRK